VKTRGIIVGETPYRVSVRSAIEGLYQEGVFNFTAFMLANRLGRKVTHNLKRTLGDLEREGVITSYRFYTERGGLAKAYSLYSQREFQGHSRTEQGAPF